MKKRVMSVLLAAAMVFSMAACTPAAETTTSAETDANAITSAADLPGKTIGVQLGTTGDTIATEYEAQGSKVERYNKGADAIQALLQGKVDCVIIDNNPAKSFVDKNSDKLTILEEELATEEYAMCLSKDNEALLDEINEALGQLKEYEILDEINKNYIGDEKGQYPYESDENIDRSKGTLVMATNAAFEPYEYYENQEIVGIDVDIAQAVCDLLGYELKIEDMEFDSIINAVVSGKADIGVAGMTVTEDRKLSVNFTTPYTEASQVIIVRQ